MKCVQLFGTNLVTSTLGFGTVGGRLEDVERLRNYEHAFALGVTHFDTARVYGLGYAERLLGRFLAGKRHSVTLTTKVGILPPRHGLAIGAMKAASRFVGRVLPNVAMSAKRNVAAKLVSTRRFSVADATASLEASLRELNTDYIDVLLLHECTPEDVQPELLEFLEKSVRAGRVRFTGVATSAAGTAEILSAKQEFPKLVQIGNSLTRPVLAELDLSQRAVITHSIMGESLLQLQTFFAARPALRSQWSQSLQLDLADSNTLAALHLRYALTVNPHGVTLYYSSDPSRIAAAVSEVNAPSVCDEQLSGFVALVNGSHDEVHS